MGEKRYTSREKGGGGETHLRLDSRSTHHRQLSSRPVSHSGQCRRPGHEAFFWCVVARAWAMTCGRVSVCGLICSANGERIRWRRAGRGGLVSQDMKERERERGRLSKYRTYRYGPQEGVVEVVLGLALVQPDENVDGQRLHGGHQPPFAELAVLCI